MTKRPVQGNPDGAFVFSSLAGLHSNRRTSYNDFSSSATVDLLSAPNAAFSSVHPSPMKHLIIKLSLAVLTVVTIVGGFVYVQGPELGDRSDRSVDPSSVVDTLTEATSSLLESLPTPAVGPPPAEAAPAISWTPSSINEIVGQGDTKTVTASFTASESLSNVVVRVVPDLQPFVQVSPASFPSISKGQTLALNITISTSSTATLGTVNGTIQLQLGTSAPKTFARPLPVMLDVWHTFVNHSAGYQVLFGPTTVSGSSSLVQLPEARDIGLIHFDVFETPTAGPPNSYRIEVFTIPAGTSVDGFVRSIEPTYYASDVLRTEVSINGSPVVRLASVAAKQIGFYLVRGTSLYAIEWSSYEGDGDPALSEFERFAHTFQLE